MRGRLPSTFPVVVGWVLVVVLALMVLVRFPGAYHSLNTAAAAAKGRNELGGALATADSISLNDDFVRGAFQQLPKNAPYAVVLPKDEAAVEQSEGVSAITFDGVSEFFGDYLLPRRQLPSPVAGGYVICFYCNQAAFGRRMHWLTPVTGGGRIGYLGQ